MNGTTATVVAFGVCCAANPWGIMMAVLLLEARRGHGVVWAYVLAWIGAISVVLLVVLAGLGAFFEAGSSGASTAVSVVEVALGGALLTWGAIRLVRAQPTNTGPGAAPAEQRLPRWLQAVENISYPAAFLLGIYSATYPFVIAAAGEILNAGTSSLGTAILAVLFVAIGSSSVFLVAALGTFAPDRSGAFLERLRAWLTVHNRAVVSAILLVFGVTLLSRGLGGLV